MTAQGPPVVEVAGFSPGARLDEELSWPGWYLWLWVHGALPLREGSHPCPMGSQLGGPWGVLLLLWSRAAAWVRVGGGVRPGFAVAPF